MAEKVFPMFRVYRERKYPHLLFAIFENELAAEQASAVFAGHERVCFDGYHNAYIIKEDKDV